MESTVIKSNKGINDKVYHLGFEYLKDGNNKNVTVIYYCCANYKSLKCPGRLIRYLNKTGDDQFKVSKDHTHVGDGTLVGKALTMRSMKRKATDTLESGRHVIAKVNNNIDVATAATLPKTPSMFQAIRRGRTDSDLPKNPTSLIDLEIPEALKLINDQVFLLYDSGPGPNRMLIFSTVKNLEILKMALVMATDGTFDIVPPMFEQLYTLQGRVNGWYVPLVYCLLANKKKTTYEQVFKIVTKYVPELKPSYIITDFEIGAINAARKYWPNAKIHACFFHLCQSVWRHVCAVGLQSRYVNEPSFALGIRQLLALAFVPPEDVVKRFEELCTQKFWAERENDADSAKLQELLSYFESTYIGLPTRNKLGRKTVTFPPTMWSVYEITILGLPRTNNYLEAWHGVLKRSIGASHPTIFKFLESLQIEQKFQELRIAKVVSGHPPEITPRKYRELNERLLTTVKGYKAEAVQAIDYLKMLAFNISF